MDTRTRCDPRPTPGTSTRCRTGGRPWSAHPSAIGVTLACLAVVALAIQPAAGEYEEDWLRTAAGFWGQAVAMDDHGNVYVTGASPNLPTNGFRHDIDTIKYGPDGDLLWLRRYNNDDDPTNQDDDPSWLTVDSRGHVIVTGTTHTNATGVEAVTLKYDPDGNLAWERLHGAPDVTSDYGSFVATDPEDNVYVTGRSFGENWDFLTVKYDAAGTRLWSRRRAFGGPDEPRGLDVDADGRVVVVGQNWNQRVVTVVYDTDGNELWSATLDEPDPGPLYSPSHTIFDRDGAVLVTGSKGGQVLLAKYATDGTLLFERTYGSGTSSRVHVDSGNNPVMTGESASFDMHTLKVDSDGQLLWVATFDSGGEDLGLDLKVLADDGIVVGGTGGWQVWTLVEYDSGGNEQGSIETDPGGIIINYPRMMAIDPNENIAMTGSSSIATARFTRSTTAVQLAAPPAVSGVFLGPPHPNPRRGAGAVAFEVSLLRSDSARLVLYDATGRLVATRQPRVLAAGGTQRVQWNPGLLASGVYYVRLVTSAGRSAAVRIVQVR